MKLKPAKGLKQSHMLAIAGAGLLVTLVIIWQLISYASAAPVANQFPITVGIIALIGTLWTGAITFAGLLLKDSVDRRSALLQVESEKRLRMDTALKAVELISKAEVEGAPVQESREAAIMVISSLNQLRLALNLGEQFWRRGKISTDAMVQVVSLCLQSDDDDLKVEACYALKCNHRKLCEDREGLKFPTAACMNWNGNLPLYAKIDIVHALILGMLSKKFTYWDRGGINWVIYCLYKMFMNDKERRFRYATSIYAINLCNISELFPGDWIMPADRHKITFEEIRNAARDIVETLGTAEENIADEDYEILQQIQGWKNRDGESEAALSPASVPTGSPSIA